MPRFVTVQRTLLGHTPAMRLLRLLLRPVAFSALAATFALGCSRPSASSDGTRQPEVRGCVKEGDRCEFAPGKIGLCTAKPEGCNGDPCLTCVSLH